MAGIVACHLAAFPGQFMTAMGSRWLESLYSFMLSDPDGILLVAIDDQERTVGFVAGGGQDIRDRFLSDAVRRYPALLCWKWLTVRIVRNTITREILRRIQSRLVASNRGESGVSKKRTGPRCGLLSIAVLPECEGFGIGSRLVEAFDQACARRGYEAVSLSVKTQNQRGIDFYKKNDFKEVRRTPTGIWFERNLADE